MVLILPGIGPETMRFQEPKNETASALRRELDQSLGARSSGGILLFGKAFRWRNASEDVFFDAFCLFLSLSAS